jgi:hypothetical protein
VIPAPDVAGLLEALVALPDRTQQQQQAYALQLDGLHWVDQRGGRPDDIEAAKEDATCELLGRLQGLKLSKAARKAIEEEFSDYEIDWL